MQLPAGKAVEAFTPTTATIGFYHAQAETYCFRHAHKRIIAVNRSCDE